MPVMEAPTETHPALSCDGMGINNERMTRVATFRNPSFARQYGPLFATSPSLLSVCKAMLPLLSGEEFIEKWHIEVVRNVIDQAEGNA